MFHHNSLYSSVLIISMGIKVAVSCTVLYILLDVVVSTVLYTHGSHFYSIFKEDALNFDIVRSVLDLWGTVLLRASLLLGASIGVSWNRVDGPPRVAKLTTLVLFVCMIVITYTLAKLLMLTELGPLTQRPWLLSLICWNCAASLGVVLLWGLLGREPSSASSRSSGSGGEGGSEDTEKLVETAGEEDGREGKKTEEEGGQEDKTSSGATLGRLLTYCKKDSGLLSVAILFLLISAVCECL